MTTPTDTALEQLIADLAEGEYTRKELLAMMANPELDQSHIVGDWREFLPDEAPLFWHNLSLSAKLLLYSMASGAAGTYTGYDL